jgi:hypothetical protein
VWLSRGSAAGPTVKLTTFVATGVACDCRAVERDDGCVVPVTTRLGWFWARRLAFIALRRSP